MGLYLDLVRGLVSIRRFFEFMEVPVQELGNISVGNFNFNKLVFHNVDFKYDGEIVLNNLNLELIKGKKYALVGPSGCGKSTIVNLLLRFYDIDKENIFIDDIPIQKINLFDLRESIALVSQDNQIFNDSIWKNIQYGNLNSSNEAIEKSAQIVDMHTFISTLNDNYNSIIGDRGAKLSGGQIQRIAIARAILKNSDILIFDEATSALDSESERIIFENLKNILTDKTIIFISHRLSTIKDVDEILCVDKGRIVEQGKHEELLKNRSYYWNLFKDQIL
jgi:ABC-type multidrug transport system fused ATPase/permease subunit